MDKLVENFKNRLQDKFFVITLIALAVLIIGVFLPLCTMDVYFIKVSTNYFMNEGELADGIFVLIGAIATLVLLAYNKDKFGFIPLGLLVLLLINLSTDLVGQEYVKLGIGYYAMILGLGGSIFGLVMLIKNDNDVKPANQPKVVDAKFEEVKPTTTASFCSNCGAKNTDNSAFCSECGNKF